MAKSKKKETTKSPDVRAINKRPVPEYIQDVLYISVIIILMAVLYKPMLIDGLSVKGSDVVAKIGKLNQIREYNKTHDDLALWNPGIFGGMPHYHDYGPKAFSLDNLLQILIKYSSKVFVFFLFGAIGMYVLLRYLKFVPLLAFAGTMMFILLPHYKSLWIVGHFRKVRAIMYIPWIILSFRYFLDKRSLLSAAIFTVFFAVQIRTQHYQIIFYTGLFILAVGLYPFLADLFEKKYKLFTKSVALLIGALIFSIAMSAQPLFLAKEYLPYSKRGKTTIDLSKLQAEQKQIPVSQGVSPEYAAKWSTAPSELLTWLIPKYYGGMSSEKYSGSKYPRLKNQIIPGYWGHMPFTQSYEYLGVITLILAFIGIYANRKNPFIRSMLVFVIFLIILSFGRHFLFFYKIFYDYIPYFNKFRAPMMSVTITSIVFVIFAVYGLKYLSEIKQGERSNYYKPIFIIFCSYFALGVLVWITGQNYSFIKIGEQYNPQVWEIIKGIRKEFFTYDIIRYFMILCLTFLVVWSYTRKNISFKVLSIIITIFIVIDLIDIQSRYQEKYTATKKTEMRLFKKTPTDKFLERDESIYRIFPVGNLFQDNRWAYYHQTIGGYSPIKMYTIEELIQNNLYQGWNKELPINWNVLKILNVKYLISEQNLPIEQLQIVQLKNKHNKLNIYQFKEYLYRGYFVSKTETIKDEFERLKRINQQSFDPAKTAILEEEISAQIYEPDSTRCMLSHFDLNRSVYDVYTDKSTLFVISELYYPPGWKIMVDDTEIEKIYKTNHAIQSIIVPEGNHKIEIRFEPDSYFSNIRVATVSSITIYLIIVSVLLFAHRETILNKIRP